MGQDHDVVISKLVYEDEVRRWSLIRSCFGVSPP